MSKRAVITGIAGQDGSYLTELLLAKGYIVHGTVAPAASPCILPCTARIDFLLRAPEYAQRLLVHVADVTDAAELQRLLELAEPDEVYNLAALSHVHASFARAEHTDHVVGQGARRVFEAVRAYEQRWARRVRVFQAGSSEMFGCAQVPQDERTPFAPRSPYARAKTYAHQQALHHREHYGMYVANGILFNHESPRRGETFVTRKITRAAARIKCGLQQELLLGHLDVRRDWGFAGDYVEAMWLTLQRDQADDFVIASGESQTVRTFLELVFGCLDLDWRKYVELDPGLLRPVEVAHYEGNARKARELLGWQPRTSFRQLVQMMTVHDLGLARMERASTDAALSSRQHVVNGGF